MPKPIRYSLAAYAYLELDAENNLTIEFNDKRVTVGPCSPKSVTEIAKLFYRLGPVPTSP